MILLYFIKSYKLLVWDQLYIAKESIFILVFFSLLIYMQTKLWCYLPIDVNTDDKKIPCSPMHKRDKTGSPNWMASRRGEVKHGCRSNHTRIDTKSIAGGKGELWRRDPNPEHTSAATNQYCRLGKESSSRFPWLSKDTPRSRVQIKHRFMNNHVTERCLYYIWSRLLLFSLPLFPLSDTSSSSHRLLAAQQ